MFTRSTWDSSPYLTHTLYRSVSSNFHLHLNCAIRNNPVGVKSRAEEFQCWLSSSTLPCGSSWLSRSPLCISYPETLLMICWFWKAISPCQEYWLVCNSVAPLHSQVRDFPTATQLSASQPAFRPALRYFQLIRIWCQLKVGIPHVTLQLNRCQMSSRQPTVRRTRAGRIFFKEQECSVDSHRSSFPCKQWNAGIPWLRFVCVQENKQ